MIKNGTKKIETGYDFRNFLAGGKISDPAGLLLLGDKSIDKTAMLANFVFKGVTKEDQNGVFVTFNKSPENIIDDVKTLGWDFDRLVKKNKILFLDASPSLYCEEIGACDTMSPLLERLKYAVEKNQAKRVAIDGLQNIFQKICDKKLIREIIFKIVEMLRMREISYLIASEESPYLAQSKLENYLADATVEVFRKTNADKNVNRFKIIRIKDVPVKSSIVNFEIGSGGLKIDSTNSQQIKL